MTTNIAEIVEKAADLIETVGWTQRTDRMIAEDGTVLGYCTLGALYQACDLYRAFERSPYQNAMANKAYDVAVDAVCLYLTDYISDWNDKPGRTASEVIDLLKHTAKDLRNKEEVHNG